MRKAFIKCIVTGQKYDKRLKFYLHANGETHYMFDQTFHNTVYDYYRDGVSVDQAINYSFAKGNAALQRAMDRIPAQLQYLENEYNVVALQKSKTKAFRHSNKYSKEVFV